MSHPLPDSSPVPQTKFIVFAHFRTGSGLLCDLLNMHPAIQWDYEILYNFLESKMKPSFLGLFIKGLIARTDAPVYGCGIKLHQLNQVHPNPTQFMTTHHQEGWQVIYLRQQNLLRAAISNFVAAQQQWYALSRDSSLTLPKTHVDCQELVNLLRWYDDIAQQEAEVLADLPHLSLVYEDALLDPADHQPALDRVFAYLGIPSAPVQAKSRRTSTNHLADYLENYQEVVTFVKQTDYARYLEENEWVGLQT